MPSPRLTRDDVVLGRSMPDVFFSSCLSVAFRTAVIFSFLVSSSVLFPMFWRIPRRRPSRNLDRGCRG